MKEKRAKNVIEIGSRIVVSTDEPVSTDKDTAKSNYISLETPSIEDITIEKMNYELIEDVMKSILTEREFFAICYRFGIINEVNNVPGKKTLEDVGIVLGITRQRVNQLFKSSFEKIKVEYESRMSENTYVKKKTKN